MFNWLKNILEKKRLQRGKLIADADKALSVMRERIVRDYPQGKDMLNAARNNDKFGASAVDDAVSLAIFDGAADD